MEISSLVLLYAFYVVLGIFVLFALMNIFHLFRFGLIGFSGLFVGLAFVVVAGLLVTQSLDLVRSHDWTETFTLSFSR